LIDNAKLLFEIINIALPRIRERVMAQDTPL